MTSPYRQYYANNKMLASLCEEGSFARKMYLQEVRWKVSNFLGLLPPSAHNGKVLEIGCATGDLLHAFPATHKTGIDLSAECIAFAAKKYPDCTFTTGDYSEIDGSYDLIILSEVLEHVEDADALLDFALSHSPKVLLNVPLENECKHPPAYGLYIHPDGHLRGYTRTEILQFANKFGRTKTYRIRSFKHTPAFYLQQLQKAYKRAFSFSPAYFFRLIRREIPASFFALISAKENKHD